MTPLFFQCARRGRRTRPDSQYLGDASTRACLESRPGLAPMIRISALDKNELAVRNVSSPRAVCRIAKFPIKSEAELELVALPFGHEREPIFAPIGSLVATAIYCSTATHIHCKPAQPPPPLLCWAVNPVEDTDPATICTSQPGEFEEFTNTLLRAT